MEDLPSRQRQLEILTWGIAACLALLSLVAIVDFLSSHPDDRFGGFGVAAALMMGAGFLVWGGRTIRYSPSRGRMTAEATDQTNRSTTWKDVLTRAISILGLPVLVGIAWARDGGHAPIVLAIMTVAIGAVAAFIATRPLVDRQIRLPRWVTSNPNQTTGPAEWALAAGGLTSS